MRPDPPRCAIARRHAAATLGVGFTLPAIMVATLFTLPACGCRGEEGMKMANTPEDFSIEAVTGSLVPGEENQSLTIAADGAAQFARFIPSEVGGAPLQEESFQVSPEQLADLWSVVQQSGFFELDPLYSREDVSDGALASVTVVANGENHSVQCENVRLVPLDAVLEALNRLVPEGARLIYQPPSP